MYSGKRARSKKRLLFVVEAMGGGVFTYIVNLSNRLVVNFDLYVAYAVRPQTPKDYRGYFDPRIHLIRVENFVRQISPKQDFGAFLELKRIYQEVQPDVIHLHSSKAGILGRFAYWHKGIPLFYTPHGYSFLMRRASTLKRAFYRSAELAMAQVRCITIACSRGELEEALRLSRHALLVSNGVDTHEIDRIVSEQAVGGRCQRRQGETFTVFTIGRICGQKNPELFNRIALSLPEVCFLWIGDGELRGALTAPNIEVSGWVDRAQVLRLASQADCFLLPSLWEGLPISLLEAMYLQKPCVVSNVIGNRDVIQDGRNGFVCDTVDQYVRAIRMASDPKTARTLCQAALHDVQEEYNIDVMARRYQEIYERALQMAPELIDVAEFAAAGRAL